MTEECPKSPKDLPKINQSLKDELVGFEKGELKDSRCVEKGVLPTKEDLEQERMQHDLLRDVSAFAKENLKHADTEVKNPLPDFEAIQLEKKSVLKSTHERIERFDSQTLKHTETVEKNPLPTKEAVEREASKDLTELSAGQVPPDDASQTVDTHAADEGGCAGHAKIRVKARKERCFLKYLRKPKSKQGKKTEICAESIESGVGGGDAPNEKKRKSNKTNRASSRLCVIS